MRGGRCERWPLREVAVVRGSRCAEVAIREGSNVHICFCPSCG